MRQVEDPNASTFPKWLSPIVIVLIVGHLVALTYWLFRITFDKQPPRRRKTQ